MNRALPTEPDIEIHHTSQTFIWRAPDGICRVVGQPGSKMTLEEADAQLDTLRALGAGRRVPVLVDIRQVKEASRPFRQRVSSAEAAQVLCAVGLLIDSPLSRTIGNFFLGLNKPTYPVKLFTDDVKAVKWLTAFSD